MSNPIQITGTVRRQNLSGGFWGVIDAKGRKWRPVQMPAELCREGLRVQLDAIPSAEISIFMWGTAVEITAFQIL